MNRLNSCLLIFLFYRKPSDPLTWHVVSNSTEIFDHDLTMRDRRIVLNVVPGTKLGLGICKGPDWKPGIFVQFTKEHSIARECLRPGDQILSCNGVDFNDILFSDAGTRYKFHAIS